MVLNRRECDLDVVKKRVDSLSYASEVNEFLPYLKLRSDYVHDVDIIRFRVTNVKIFN